MKKDMLVLFFCLFVAMMGFGSTLPVLPFYIERLALADGESSAQASIQVGVLTGIFALMQFFFAPLWGKLSDKAGRRFLIIMGLGGYAIFMAIFAIGTNLLMLYAARILGGVLSAAVMPAAGAYVADVTIEENRGQGMAWLGSATGLGIVFGPVMGAFLSRNDLHINYSLGHFRIDGFSIPFFFAALLSLIALSIAMRWLPEPHNSLSAVQMMRRKNNIESKASQWIIFRRLTPFLVMAFLSQYGLSIFEGTFALHAKIKGQFGPTEMGWVFMMCGFVMAAAQATAVSRLIKAYGEKPLLPIGFALMGIGLMLLMATSKFSFVLIFVGLFASGVALITPSLATLVSRNEKIQTGIALGQLNAANNLGLFLGPTVGGILITWNIHSPYLLTALLLIVFAGYITIPMSRKLF
ncbi:MAG: MFS transporter [Candidatus Atribacteria bacterium]|nr:MAG: MFS transporter [Candidatus Atribacteria bacterium]